MKKHILILILLISLFMLSGCGETADITDEKQEDFDENYDYSSLRKEESKKEDVERQEVKENIYPNSECSDIGFKIENPCDDVVSLINNGNAIFDHFVVKLYNGGSITEKELKGINLVTLSGSPGIKKRQQFTLIEDLKSANKVEFIPVLKHKEIITTYYDKNDQPIHQEREIEYLTCGENKLDFVPVEKAKKLFSLNLRDYPEQLMYNNKLKDDILVIYHPTGPASFPTKSLAQGYSKPFEDKLNMNEDYPFIYLDYPSQKKINENNYIPECNLMIYGYIHSHWTKDDCVLDERVSKLTGITCNNWKYGDREYMIKLVEHRNHFALVVIGNSKEGVSKAIIQLGDYKTNSGKWSGDEYVYKKISIEEIYNKIELGMSRDKVAGFTEDYMHKFKIQRTERDGKIQETIWSYNLEDGRKLQIFWKDGLVAGKDLE